MLRIALMRQAPDCRAITNVVHMRRAGVVPAAAILIPTVGDGHVGRGESHRLDLDGPDAAAAGRRRKSAADDSLSPAAPLAARDQLVGVFSEEGRETRRVPRLAGLDVARDDRAHRRGVGSAVLSHQGRRGRQEPGTRDDDGGTADDADHAGGPSCRSGSARRPPRGCRRAGIPHRLHWTCLTSAAPGCAENAPRRARPPSADGPAPSDRAATRRQWAPRIRAGSRALNRPR